MRRKLGSGVHSYKMLFYMNLSRHSYDATYSDCRTAAGDTSGDLIDVNTTYCMDMSWRIDPDDGLCYNDTSNRIPRGIYNTTLFEANNLSTVLPSEEYLK